MPQISAPTPDATTLAKGKIQLAGDLNGTAALPRLSTSAIKLGITDVTTPVSHTTTETTIASVTVTVPTGGRDVEIKCIVPQVNSSVTSDRVKVNIKEGATILQTFYHVITNSAGIFETTISAPASGSHTYIITGTRDVGSGTVQWYADASGATIKLLAKLI